MQRSTRAALRPLRIGLAAALALLLAGCEREVVTTDYFPLRDGNRWEYRFLDDPLLKRLAAGQPVETQPAPAPAATPLPDKDAPGLAVEVNEGAPAEKPAEPSARARRVILELRASREALTYDATYDGHAQVWSKKGGFVGFQDSRARHYLLILPPHTGYRWVVTGGGGENLYYQVEGHADLETPAGPFHNCAVTRQESRDQREVTRCWFAPEAGLVRRSKYFLEHEVFRQELVAWQVRRETPAQREAEDREVQEALKGKGLGKEYRAGMGGLLDMKR